MPRPDCAVESVQVRATAVSHATVQLDHTPAQFLFAGQLPSPGRQSEGSGHGAPTPN